MARAIWSGVLTFGLVTVPVQLFTATEDHTVHFHQFQRGTSDRVRRRQVNERTGEEVAYRDIVKGYALGEGDYVIVDPEELRGVAPGKSQTVDIVGFVDLDRIEPAYFDRTYYVAPRGEEYTKVYELLRTALQRANKTGIATLVMRNKQYLVALRAQDTCLVLHTLHWSDEVRDPRRELPVLPEQEQVGDRELRTAEQLIEAMSMDWRPEDFHDTYRERVEDLIRAKAEGREVVTAEGPPEATNVVDLMGALQRSIERSRGGTEPPAEGPAAPSDRGEDADSGSGGGPERTREAGEPERRRGTRREDLERLTKTELYRRASERNVSGRSHMDRRQLIDALLRAESGGAAA